MPWVKRPEKTSEYPHHWSGCRKFKKKSEIQDSIDAQLIKKQQSENEVPVSSEGRIIPASMSRTREKYDWQMILNDYLTPIIEENQDEDEEIEPKWKTRLEIATKYNIPMNTLKCRMQQYNWIILQHNAEQKLWAGRNEKVYRMMARKLPQIQGKTFLVAEKAIDKLDDLIENVDDENAVYKAMSATEKALNIAFSASGNVIDKAQVIEGVKPFLQLSEQIKQTVYDKNGQPISSVQRQTLLEMFQNRSLSAGQTAEVQENTGEYDEYDGI